MESGLRLLGCYLLEVKLVNVHDVVYLAKFDATANVLDNFNFVSDSLLENGDFYNLGARGDGQLDDAELDCDKLVGIQSRLVHDAVRALAEYFTGEYEFVVELWREDRCACCYGVLDGVKQIVERCSLDETGRYSWIRNRSGDNCIQKQKQKEEHREHFVLFQLSQANC